MIAIIERITRRSLHRALLAALGASCALGAATVACAEPPADPPPAQAEETEDAPPSLDELLGIEEGGGDEAAVAERDAEDELQRRLTRDALRDVFELTIEKMSYAAEQLDERFDTGLGTQRVQEEVLDRLSQLIEEARKQQASGGSSSQSQSRSRGQQPQQSPGRQSRSPNGQNNPSPTDSTDTQDRGPTEPPPGQRSGVFEENRTEWGSLPQRVREMLLQGRREKFSSLYEQLTREYYRRLAEEGSSR